MVEAVDPSRAYITTTPQEQREMLLAVGASDIHELFLDIPASIYNPRLNLPAPMTEMELMIEMQGLSDMNSQMPSFLGGGAYRRWQPALVRDITRRDEYLTSYTPYQPEISQGTLQTAFEFQTMMCGLYDMDISNTAMYDGATAMAEAALMAARLKPGRGKIVALDTVHPNWLDTTRTYLSGKDLELVTTTIDKVGDEMHDAAAVMVQSPNYLGSLEDLKALGEQTHQNGGLFVVAADPVSLGLLKSPGEYGADIAVGEGQSLGNPLQLGGVNLGIFTARNEHMRQIPGRIVGQTTELHGEKKGWALTLQTREQHIRRQSATSNICTAEQLVALASTIYLSLLGPEGLRRVAELNYHNAHYLASEIGKKSGYSIANSDKPFFNEFVVQSSLPPVELNQRLFDEGIIGGIDVSDRVDNGMLLCATEVTTKKQMDQLVAVLP